MKFLFKIMAFMACTQFLIHTANAQGSQYDGPYIGLDGSYDKHTPVSATLITQPTGFVLPSTAAYSDDGISAGIFVGYRQSLENFTVAAEARYTYSFVSNQITATDTFNPTNEYGASVMPGYWLTNEVVVFGRLGFSQQNINRNYQGSLFNNTDTGLIYGGGIEIYVNELFSLRADYTRTTHNHRMNLTVNNQSAVFFNNIRRERIRGSIVAKF